MTGWHPVALVATGLFTLAISAVVLNRYCDRARAPSAALRRFYLIACALLVGSACVALWGAEAQAAACAGFWSRSPPSLTSGVPMGLEFDPCPSVASYVAIGTTLFVGAAALLVVLYAHARLASRPAA